MNEAAWAKGYEGSVAKEDRRPLSVEVNQAFDAVAEALKAVSSLADELSGPTPNNPAPSLSGEQPAGSLRATAYYCERMRDMAGGIQREVNRIRSAL